MAEREGFEPPVGVNPQVISNHPLSATQPPLLKLYYFIRSLKKFL